MNGSSSSQKKMFTLLRKKKRATDTTTTVVDPDVNHQLAEIGQWIDEMLRKAKTTIHQKRMGILLGLLRRALLCKNILKNIRHPTRREIEIDVYVNALHRTLCYMKKFMDECESRKFQWFQAVQTQRKLWVYNDLLNCVFDEIVGAQSAIAAETIRNQATQLQEKNVELERLKQEKEMFARAFVTMIQVDRNAFAII